MVMVEPTSPELLSGLIERVGVADTALMKNKKIIE
jgi:hypothetical protein